MHFKFEDDTHKVIILDYVNNFVLLSTERSAGKWAKGELKHLFRLTNLGSLSTTWPCFSTEWEHIVPVAVDILLWHPEVVRVGNGEEFVNPNGHEYPKIVFGTGVK